MHRRARRLKKIPVTCAAVERSQGTAVGMPVGRDIAQPEPAAIATGGSGTEMARGVHLAAASACGDDGGWRGTGGLRARRGGVLTRVTIGLVGEARKGCGCFGALARYLGKQGRLVARGGAVVWPHHVEHETQPQKAHEQ